MDIFLIVWLSVLSYLVIRGFRVTDEKVKILSKSNSSMFWALKEKDLIDFKDLKKGQDIAKGNKSPDMGLIDLIDRDKLNDRTD